MTNDQKEAMERLLNKFDFERVEETMRALGWQWFNGYPDEAQMRRSIWRLYQAGLEGLERSDHVGSTMATTGGFRVTIDPVKNLVSVVFAVTARGESYASQTE